MKKSKRYYIAENHDDSSFNAGILRKDNEQLLHQMEFKPIKLKQYKNGHLLTKLHRLIYTIQTGCCIPKNSIVLFHLPFLANAHVFIFKLLKWRGVKIIALVIDLDGIRDGDATLLNKEKNYLLNFQIIIAHNEIMKIMLQDFCPKSKIFNINLFDYPVAPLKIHRKISTQICFAGNLLKAAFVYQLYQLKALNFTVYGNGYNQIKNNPASFTYAGVVSPQNLPQQLQGSFGLVWDGNSITDCDDYLRINSPHKLSLYLAAGLPVIVWKHSAVATFIESNQLGFTVESLHEIAFKIEKISAAEYEKMCQNAINIGKQVASGYFLKSAISKIEETV